MTPVDVEKQINLPVETVAIVMENMSMLGIIERIEKLKWHVKPRFKTLVEQADLI
jgi:predicted transcriptional regulator